MSLDFSRTGKAGQTQMTVRDAQPPLKVIRAFETESGAALVHLHNISGGLLGGDHLEMQVTVGAAAHTQLTTTSATRVYKRRAGLANSRQSTRISVAENGRLEYLPDALIPYAEAAYEQHTQIDLADGASLVWWETVAPGREAHGELFAYDLVVLNTEITANDRPIALETARLEPKRRPLDWTARLGRYRYFSTMYVCRVGEPAARWTALETELSDLASAYSSREESVWGVGTLAAHGLVIRGLSTSGLSIPQRLFGFWDAAQRALFDEPAVPPRKIY